MAQSRLTDAGRLTKGFSLVFKAFFNMGCKEAEQNLNNCSVTPSVTALKSKLNDCMECIIPKDSNKMDFSDEDFNILNADDWKPVHTGVNENIRPKMQTTEGGGLHHGNNIPHARRFHTLSCYRIHPPTSAVSNVPVCHFNYNTEVVAADMKKFTKGEPPRKTRNRQVLSERARERTVPSSRMGRVWSFGELAAGLGVGAIAELTRRGLGLAVDSNKSALLTEANADRIVNTLCKVRGAALKIGQMLSIQDNSMISPELQMIFERVRQSADFMPVRQMTGVLKKEFGDDWRLKVKTFEEKPFAAASIGQVHLATLHDGKEVAMKIQYPGVGKGINSDIDNLMTILNIWNILPEGLYIESAMNVARRELSWEIDYEREAMFTEKFRNLLIHDPIFQVPTVISELSSKEVLTTELIDGIPLDKAKDLDQETRNMISYNILRLCLTELFEWFVMQTDPNWSNFFYNKENKKIWLLDFGATREFNKSFVDTYIRIIHAARIGDMQAVLDHSRKLGFLTGYESKVMTETHIEAVMILGEAFTSDKPFDFAKQDTTKRIHSLVSTMLHHRLTPPPAESYSLHRKMAGAFLLCSKLNANISCKELFDNVWLKYEFDDE